MLVLSWRSSFIFNKTSFLTSFIKCCFLIQTSNYHIRVFLKKYVLCFQNNIGNLHGYKMIIRKGNSEKNIILFFRCDLKY
jgi:hypothetical protein